MQKHYIVAYISTMEDEVKEKLNKIGKIEFKHTYAHCFEYSTNHSKTEISNIKGVLYVEEEKEC